MSCLICSQARHYTKFLCIMKGAVTIRMIKGESIARFKSKVRDDNSSRISCSIKSASLIAITKTKMLLLTFLSKVPCQKVACVGTRN